ncbi:CD1375 family protein [Cohnella panacarvi]|nr:CD1375 family protein [Cohnella panacarvi]
MAKIYYDLITAGQWQIENVPIRWRSAVQTLLDADIQEGSA